MRYINFTRFSVITSYFQDYEQKKLIFKYSIIKVIQLLNSIFTQLSSPLAITSTILHAINN